MIDTSYTSRSIKSVPFQLYDYQKPIVKKAVECIQESKSGLIVQPTGTGKTIEAAFIARACILLHKMKGLYVYNANEGVEQARIKFQEIFNGNNIISASFFGYEKDNHVGEADIVFASFQSLNSQEKWYQMFDEKHFDFIIVNEGHNAQAPTYREVLDYFKCSKIGMTATPSRMDKKDIREIFHVEIANIKLEEAIVNGWVARIEYHILSSNLSSKNLQKICKEVLEEGKRVTLKQLNETVFVQRLDEQIIQEIDRFTFSEMGKSQQVLVFCENIRHAEHIYKLFLRKNKRVGVVHSQKNVFQNRQTLQDFRNKKFQFLVSVNQLNEDIDIPEAMVGVFLRATESQTIWLQQIGRLLRKTPYKTKAIILDFVANIDRLIMINQLSQRVEKAEKKLLQKTKSDKTSKIEKEVLYVSGECFEFTFSDQVMKLLDVVRILNSDFYSTWQEASEAAINLSVMSKSDYSKKYSKDSRLPSTPNRAYSDFPGWYIFLQKERVIDRNREIYSCWHEASRAVKKLGINSRREYRVRYLEDEKLPSNPNISYSDFPTWDMFFGKEKVFDSNREFYPIWQEASQAAIRLGIVSSPDYSEKYKSDPRLPSGPDVKYKDFPGWRVFLKTDYYPTWQEASQAAIRLGIVSSTDYFEKYKPDRQLPSNPSKVYKDFPGWKVFLNAVKKYPTWQEASQAAILLNILGQREYQKRYSDNERLPSAPRDYYKDFPGWKVFLGKKK